MGALYEAGSIMRKRLKKKLGLNLRCYYCGCILTSANYYTNSPYVKDRRWWKKVSTWARHLQSCDDCIPF